MTTRHPCMLISRTGSTNRKSSCVGNEFVESGLSLKHQILIKCSSFGPRLPLLIMVGKTVLHAD